MKMTAAKAVIATLTRRNQVFSRSLQLLLLAQTLLTQPSQSFSIIPDSPSLNMKSKTSLSSTSTKHNFSSSTSTSKKIDPLMPTMIVFDLDDCLWSPEMYTLNAKPSIPIERDLNPDYNKGTTPSDDNNAREIGIVGMQVPRGPTVRLFDGARQALREIALDEKYKGVIVAAASSSEEPTFSHACLNGIEVLPGLTMRDMFKYDQIGRTGSLTSRKTTHFRALHEESGVSYNEMLFFDDCNWGDHCADVTSNFGVISQRTPRGMQLSEFHAGLEKYRKEAASRGDA